FVYVSGYGVQLEGENYFVPIDAKIARDSEVAAEAIRMSDYIRPLAALKLKASIVVLDAARANPFAKSGPPLAGGLALVEPEPGVLIAFNAAPGTVAPEGQGPYGAYAQALAEMLREGGLPLAGVFDRARLRVNDLTKGAEVPWHASKVETSLVFFERAPDAPPPAVSNEQTAAIRARPIRDLAAQEAYAAALERDTLDGYSEFLTAYPDDPMAARVRAIVAARREAITWRRTRVVDTPAAYWSYLRRYPQGPHAADAHRRLAFLAAAVEPPPSFAAMAYDRPPPPPEEIVYIRRRVLVFDDPVFAFAPPPPPPVIFLAPPPPEFVVLAPPPPPVELFVLPMPIYRPVPVWVSPPAYVAPPPNNVIYNNVHNTVVVNNVTNTVTITNPSGQTQTVPPAVAMAPAVQPAAASAQQAAPAAAPAAAAPQAAPAAAAPAAAASLAPSLPPSVAEKAATLATQAPQGGAQPSAAGSAATQPAPQPGQPLPGMKGQPLPSPTGTSTTPTTPATPSAAITPGTSTPAPGSAKPATAPAQGPAAKAGDTIIAVSGDNARDSVARARERCQARNASFADAGCNAADALGRDRAGDVDVNAAVRRTCQAQNVAIANARCQAVAIDALGRGHAGDAITGAGSDQARNAATTDAGCKALCTDNAFSGDRAEHAIACKKARNSAAASARGKTADASSAAGADQTGQRGALAASGRRCQARNAATANTRCTSGGTAAHKARRPGRRCCEPGTSCGAQGCSTATQGLPGGEDHGGRERSARV